MCFKPTTPPLKLHFSDSELAIFWLCLRLVLKIMIFRNRFLVNFKMQQNCIKVFILNQNYFSTLENRFICINFSCDRWGLSPLSSSLQEKEISLKCQTKSWYEMTEPQLREGQCGQLCRFYSVLSIFILFSLYILCPGKFSLKFCLHHRVKF